MKLGQPQMVVKDLSGIDRADARIDRESQVNYYIPRSRWNSLIMRLPSF